VRLKLLGSRLEAGAGAPGEALDDALLIACGEGAVRLTRLQREGRQALSAQDYLRGAPTPRGARFF
jgi:methionyl-tRNA formyltransferase